MVRLSVRLRAPACQAAAVERTLRTLMRATRLEPGCTGCEVWTSLAMDQADRSDVHYEERWASEPAMEKRVRSDSFTKVLEVLEVAAEAPYVDFDFASRHRGLEYVEDVRRDHGRH